MKRKLRTHLYIISEISIDMNIESALALPVQIIIDMKVYYLA